MRFSEPFRLILYAVNEEKKKKLYLTYHRVCSVLVREVVRDMQHFMGTLIRLDIIHLHPSPKLYQGLQYLYIYIDRFQNQIRLYPSSSGVGLHDFFSPSRKKRAFNSKDRD